MIAVEGKDSTIFLVDQFCRQGLLCCQNYGGSKVNEKLLGTGLMRDVCSVTSSADLEFLWEIWQLFSAIELRKEFDPIQGKNLQLFHFR